jgi:hypothetical protein
MLTTFGSGVVRGRAGLLSGSLFRWRRTDYHFSHLHLRSADYPELVEAVISGINNDPRDRMLARL